MFSLYAPCGPKIVLIKLSYLILSYLCKTLGSINIAISMLQYHCVFRGRRGRHRMVVGFIITYAISVHHHECCVFEPKSG
jgi:hypothetical protein